MDRNPFEGIPFIVDEDCPKDSMFFFVNENWILLHPVHLTKKRKTMFSVAFWKAASERAVKTFVQTLLGGKVGTEVIPYLEGINFKDYIALAGIAAVGSVLSSIASIPLSEGKSPSLVPDAEVESAQQ